MYNKPRTHQCPIKKTTRIFIFRTPRSSIQSFLCGQWKKKEEKTTTTTASHRSSSEAVHLLVQKVFRVHETFAKRFDSSSLSKYFKCQDCVCILSISYDYSDIVRFIFFVLYCNESFDVRRRLR